MSRCHPTGMVHPQVAPGYHLSKGEELGYFQFGGSTYCLAFRPGVITDFALPAIPQPHDPNAPVVLVRSRSPPRPSPAPSGERPQADNNGVGDDRVLVESRSARAGWRLDGGGECGHGHVWAVGPVVRVRTSLDAAARAVQQNSLLATLLTSAPPTDSAVQLVELGAGEVVSAPAWELSIMGVLVAPG